MSHVQPCLRVLQQQASNLPKTRPASFLIPSIHARRALFSTTVVSYKASPRKKQTIQKKSAPERKKKLSAHFKSYDIKQAIPFALCDAIRYIRAFEVGQSPTSVKYELAVRLKTPRAGPVARNRIQLPHPLSTDVRICVICPPNSPIAETARKAGASVIGDEAVIAAIKEERIDFDRCLCHIDSLPMLNKAGVGKILGPKGLMPSVKTNTVVKSVGPAIRSMIGASEYRERTGVVRMAVGQLGFTPDELRNNITAFMDSLKADITRLAFDKKIAEVVLSSTSSPGFSLSGNFRSEDSVPIEQLMT